MYEPIERNREDVLHAWSLARTLHTRVPDEPQVASNAEFREYVAKAPELANLSTSTKRQLYVVAESLPVPALRSLLQLAGSPAFVEDVDFARAVLKMLSEHAMAPRAVASLATAFHEEGVLSLSPRLRRKAASVVCAGVDNPPVKRAFEALRRDKGFLSSSDGQKRVILEYLLGPTLSPEVAPMRRNRVRLLWANRVEALTRLLKSKSYRGAQPSLAQEHLRDFMCSPTQTVTFLDATARNGHAVVVFGDAHDRKTLSYGRRWVMGKQKRPVARTYAPDPSVQSGWTKPMSDSSIRYHGRSVRLSRRRELALINWVEKSYVFYDDLRAKGVLGELRVAGESAPLVDRVFAALEGMMGDRPIKVVSGQYLAGRRAAESKAGKKEAPPAQEAAPPVQT